MTEEPRLEPHGLLEPEFVDDAVAEALGVPNQPPTGPVSVGVVAPYDFALDRELWRWVPDSIALHLTRTPYSALPVTVEQAETVGDVDAVARCVLDLVTVRPEVVAYMCTSGSFIDGLAAERELVAAMIASGAPAAVTASGALLEAVAVLGIHRLAVATPYDDAITERLRVFLSEAGVEVVSLSNLGLAGRIWRVPYSGVITLVRRAYVEGCDAVFVSCTNLPSYDVIAPLEAELGVPVLTANQVTMWAAMHRAGLAPVAQTPQRLLDAWTGASA